MQPGQWYRLGDLVELVPELNSGAVSRAVKRGYMVKQRYSLHPRPPWYVYALGDPNRGPLT